MDRMPPSEGGDAGSIPAESTMKQDYSIGVIPYHGTAGLFGVVRHAAGHWGFPKGHPDIGESKSITALRELREETGVVSVALDTGRVFSERFEYDHDGERYDKTVDYFLGFVESISSSPMIGFEKEVIETRWVPYADARDLLTYENNKKLIDEVWNYLKEKGIIARIEGP